MNIPVLSVDFSNQIIRCFSINTDRTIRPAIVCIWRPEFRFLPPFSKYFVIVRLGNISIRYITGSINQRLSNTNTIVAGIEDVRSFLFQNFSGVTVRMTKEFTIPCSNNFRILVLFCRHCLNTGINKLSTRRYIWFRTCQFCIYLSYIVISKISITTIIIVPLIPPYRCHA